MHDSLYIPLLTDTQFVVFAIMVEKNAELDIKAEPKDDPSDAVDAVASFVEKIEANPNAGAPCGVGLTATDTDGDALLDTFENVNPGTRVCFDVIPKKNLVVMPTTEPQIFRAEIVVMGDNVTNLDTRSIYFLVPPENVDVPIE